MTEAAPIGHNKPPGEAEVRDRLQRDYGYIAKSIASFEQRATALPEIVNSDEEAGTLSDFVKDVAGSVKAIEAHRQTEKEPHLQAGRTIDGYFKVLSERIEKVKRTVERRVGDYLTRKAAEERRIREEQQRLAREEANRKLREAEEAAERERAAKEAAAPNTVTAMREANAAIEEAFAADRTARRAERDAAAKPSELARTRSSNMGALATLKQEWTFEVEDYAAVPLETLRPFIPQDTFDKAIRAYVKAGHKQLAGVRIFETEKAVIR